MRAIARREKPALQREPDAEDVCTPLRRALIIRSKLGAGPDARLDFDADLLSALLEIPKYTHGARSLERLVLSLKSKGDGGPIRRSALPPAGQLAMHVNALKFDDILSRNTAFLQSQIEDLAKAIHHTWWDLSKKEGWKMQPDFDKPYDDLGEVEKQENRAAARRIPEILALAGLRIEKGKRAGRKLRDEIRQQLEHHLERLAEAEHDGWMQHRLKNGWHYAEERDDKKKLHPALVPYAKLPEADKAKDRNSVRQFPPMVDLAGYRIVWT